MFIFVLYFNMHHVHKKICYKISYFMRENIVNSNLNYVFVNLFEMIEI